MKKIYKKISLLVFLFVLGNATFGQPGNVYYKTQYTPWGDYALMDRGVTSWVSIQNPLPMPMTIAFLFNPSAGNYSPKWCGSSTDSIRVVNQKINGGAFYYTSGGWDKNLNCNVQGSYYYTLIVGKNPAANNDMSILETSYNPVTITAVTQVPASGVTPSTPVTVTVTLSGAKNANEKVFVRYSADSWATSSFVEITSFNASFQGTADIPGQTAGTTVSYYALSTTQTTPDAADIDYYTLRLNNNANANYSYTVTTVTDISWCNVQWPGADTITAGGAYDVYAQVYAQGITDTIGQGAGIQAWIGYSTANTNPSTWTNWVLAAYHTDVLNNDEYKADIGTSLTAGIYYYASRFKLNSGSYYYGGFNATGGGLWDGTTNISGVLTINPVTGIEENTSIAADIYPNPATDLLTVKLNSPDGAVTLRLYNILGDAVMTDVLNSNGIIQKTYDVRDLPKGTYILNATIHNSSFTKKIVIY